MKAAAGARAGSQDWRVRAGKDFGGVQSALKSDVEKFIGGDRDVDMVQCFRHLKLYVKSVGKKDEVKLGEREILTTTDLLGLFRAFFKAIEQEADSDSVRELLAAGRQFFYRTLKIISLDSKFLIKFENLVENAAAVVHVNELAACEDAQGVLSKIGECDTMTRFKSVYETLRPAVQNADDPDSDDYEQVKLAESWARSKGEAFLSYVVGSLSYLLDHKYKYDLSALMGKDPALCCLFNPNLVQVLVDKCVDQLEGDDKGLKVRIVVLSCAWLELLVKLGVEHGIEDAFDMLEIEAAMLRAEAFSEPSYRKAILGITRQVEAIREKGTQKELVPSKNDELVGAFWEALNAQKA